MKAEIFFAGDTHFHHKKIIDPAFSKKCRPFATIEEHNDALVKNWNSVVKPNDTVWVLGDVILASTDFDILGDLNGRKKLVLGNHDTPAKIKEYEKYFVRISAYETIGKSIILSHVPVHPCELEDRFKVNIHGHKHANTLPDKRYVNVSMEAIDYTPIRFSEIKERLRNDGVI